MKNKTLHLLVIGAGDRGSLFGRIAVKKNARIVAVADPSKKMRELMAEDHDIPLERMFKSGKAALKSGMPFDGVYIASPDKTHYRLARLALKEGYNVLLEKPMATTPRRCTALLKAQEKSGKCLVICHVLRYAPFFQIIKKITDSGELGDIISIDLIEDVGYWHFAHSYVRGNWRKEKTSAPVILAKSCHDLDIISWLVHTTPKRVYSSGIRQVFKSSNAPENAAKRCVDCPVKDCIFDARKFYLNHDPPIHWPYRVISPEDTSEKARLEAIKKGPYGRCVYHCDNDVLDNQDVVIEFSNGIRANFSLRFGGEEMTRKIFVQFEKGELAGNLVKGKITKKTYTGKREDTKVESINTKKLGGHGGGDPRLVQDFLDMIRGNDFKDSLTSVHQSLQSHLIAFAAEKSRKTGKLGRIIDFKRYMGDVFKLLKKHHKKHKQYKGKSKKKKKKRRKRKQSKKKSKKSKKSSKKKKKSKKSKSKKKSKKKNKKKRKSKKKSKKSKRKSKSKKTK
ncbi:gfo/Idh/MocA family oxidoreductase [Candidatus Pacearchaeota archaeon]|nr:gfo/Idh/MocA family oxidoreductase [Candidatus Pacearchaeota archaeon]